MHPARGGMVVVWVLIAIFVTRAVLFFPGPPEMDWSRLLRRIASDWAVWLAFAPGIVWASRRFPFDGQRWPRAVVVHFLLAFAALVVHALVRRSLGAVIIWMPHDPLSFLLYAQAHINFLTYWAIAGATHVYDYYHRFRERERRAAELEAELARAQIDALTSQLQPHFLFNTMNAISAFMHEDVDRADRMLGRLGDLLRASLQQSGRIEISLDEELTFLDRYIEIYQERFGSRLRVEQAIEPSTLHALVPPLLLQPLVENAIQHGIAERLEGGMIRISSAIRGKQLELHIVNDAAAPAADRPSTGIGLMNTHRRLEQLYGPNYTLELVTTSERTDVTVCLPLHT